MVDGLLKEACASLEEFKDHALSIPQLLKIHLQVATWKQRLYYFMTAHATIARQLLATILWILLGTTYICVAEGTSFISGLYFAVTSLSTAGLYAVTSTTSGSVYWFTGIYCLVGVPLYAMMLGSYANLVVEQCTREQVLESIHQRMGRAEVAFLDHLIQKENKDQVDFADYVEIQMLRLGKVDREFLRQLKDDFNKLDESGDGKVPMARFLTQAQRKRLEHGTAAVAVPSRNLPVTLMEEAPVEVEV